MWKPTQISFETPEARFVYGREPIGKERTKTSFTETNSIDLAFLPHERSVIRLPNGSLKELQIATGDGSIRGEDVTEFVDVETPSEYLEIQFRDRFLDEFSEENVVGGFKLEEKSISQDPVLWATGCIVRESLLSGSEASSGLLSTKVISLLSHLAKNKLNTQLLQYSSPLDSRRLKKVDDYMEAFLSEHISLDELARVACMSRFHFVRSFKEATGYSPIDYLLSKRMERARQAIFLRGASVGAAAAAVSFKNTPHFRRAFRRHFGLLPSEI